MKDVPRCIDHVSARRASNSTAVSSYEVFKFCIWKMCLAALTMFVPGEPLTRQPCRVLKVVSFAYRRCASLHWSFWYLGEPLTRQSCRAGLKSRIQKMHLVELIILVPGRVSNSATESSYEGVGFAYKRWASLHWSFCYLGEPLTRPPCRVMEV